MNRLFAFTVLMLAALPQPVQRTRHAERKEGRTMTQAAVYLSTAELYQRVKQYRFKIADLPREAGQGYPVPVYRDGRLWLAVPFFTSTGAPRQPRHLFPPRWIVLIDAEKGEEIKLGRPEVKNEEAAGVHTLPPEIDLAGLRTREQKMFTLLDTLMPLARDFPDHLTDHQMVSRREYRALWQEIAQKPLLPFYRQLNPRWFSYMGLD